jgi:serine/threonine-protein phosphatase 2A catalytic subunit
MVARAHQLMNQGYELKHNNSIATIFSAPNYCYRCNNQAAFLELDENMNENYIRFDPYPRRGEEEIIKKTPTYFL